MDIADAVQRVATEQTTVSVSGSRPSRGAADGATSGPIGTTEPSTCTPGGPSALIGALGDLADAVYAAVPHAPRPVPHHGHLLANIDDPVVQQLSAVGASFDWLAFALPTVPLWDAHVGVIHVHDLTVDVGIHIYVDRSREVERLRRLAARLGLPLDYSTVAREYQLVVARAHLSQQRHAVITACVDAFHRLAQLAG